VQGDQHEDLTILLGRAAAGEAAAAAELLPLVYDELRKLAGAYFRDERRSHTLQPTALVHEAYIRLVNQPDIAWESRRQFFVLAARAMRNILVDHARGKRREKRGGGWGRVAIDDVKASDAASDTLDLIALDEALERLATLDERKARLVELRFFGGLTSEEAAKVLEISRSTAADEWRMARAWLLREMKDH
jgi:RNA polymerase sigma factor (TIGR02999 family)